MKIEELDGRFVKLTYKTPFYINGNKFFDINSALSSGLINQGEYSDMRDYSGLVSKVCPITKEDVLINDTWVNIRNRNVQEVTK